MENKGLNVFNDKYVLASAETATDDDYAGIEGVIAHEYFHNWTGNRITCRDWFQLCLKEGLTVFRDQEFTADQRSAPVKRIADVRALRSRAISRGCRAARAQRAARGLSRDQQFLHGDRLPEGRRSHPHAEDADRRRGVSRRAWIFISSAATARRRRSRSFWLASPKSRAGTSRSSSAGIRRPARRVADGAHSLSRCGDRDVPRRPLAIARADARAAGESCRRRCRSRSAWSIRRAAICRSAATTRARTNCARAFSRWRAPSRTLEFTECAATPGAFGAARVFRAGDGRGRPDRGRPRHAAVARQRPFNRWQALADPGGPTVAALGDGDPRRASRRTSTAAFVDAYGAVVADALEARIDPAFAALALQSAERSRYRARDRPRRRPRRDLRRPRTLARRARPRACARVCALHEAMAQFGAVQPRRGRAPAGARCATARLAMYRRRRSRDRGRGARATQ